MRLVRYEDPIDGIALEFHPLVTVVGGLSEGVRERLIRAASALPRSGDPQAGGAIEVHGVLLDLSPVKVEVREDPARMRPSDVTLLLGDCTKFHNVTGWKPTIAFEITLKDLLEHWRQRV